MQTQTQSTPPAIGSGTRTTGFIAAGTFAASAAISFLAGVLPAAVASLAGGFGTFLAFAGFIVFLVWTYMLFSDLKGHTRFGPGLAVGGWFIPFANLVLPPLTLRDGYRTVHGGKGGALVLLWWLTYLGFIFADLTHQTFIALHTEVDALFELSQSSPAVFTAMFWLVTLLKVASYAGLAGIVFTVTKKGSADAATPHGVPTTA